MTLPRAEPIFFGPGERPLFGWLHRPLSTSHGNLGLVICNPFGYEAVCAHRSIRHFAAAAADAGIPALRFDYDGTGDSAGDDFDPERLPGWLRSIHEAIATLQAHASVQQVCLLGIRLGATLAALASAERTDIAGLAAIVPVVNANGYLRELRALALAGRQAQPPRWAKVIPDLQESTGFIMTAATRTALMAIDLVRRQRPASRVLVVDRDDLPSNSAWIERLTHDGATVEHLRLPGYAEMMLDSHEAVVPTAMISSTIAWLNALKGAPSATPPRADVRITSTTPISVGSANGVPVEVSESALYPDSIPTFFGIVTEPAHDTGRSAPLVLLLNSGAVHHIGPNRMHVMLARLWAAAGIVVLRMDLSGLGDSAAHPGEPENDVYTARAAQDIEAAIGYMRQRRAVGECHAIGLCSGAYHGFKYAVATPALASVVAINPLTFFWKPGMSLDFPEHRIADDAMRYRKNAFQWAAWKKLLSGGVNIAELLQVLARRALGVAGALGRNVARQLHIALTDDLGAELEKTARHGTRLLFVFAEYDPGFDLLKSGAGSVYPRLLRQGHLRVAVVEGADHTFTQYWSRDQLTSVLTAHIQHQPADQG